MDIYILVDSEDCSVASVSLTPEAAYTKAMESIKSDLEYACTSIMACVPTQTPRVNIEGIIAEAGGVDKLFEFITQAGNERHAVKVWNEWCDWECLGTNLEVHVRTLDVTGAPAKYVIRAESTEGEPLFWNNETGWGSLITADVYTTEQSAGCRLPINGMWEEVPPTFERVP